MKFCPVCNAELKEIYFYASAWGEEESQHQCPNRCYTETFAYGSTQIDVCDFMTGYCYDTPQKTIDKIYKQIKAICEIEKQLIKNNTSLGNGR